METPQPLENTSNLQPPLANSQQSQFKENVKRISNGYRSSKYFKRYIQIEKMFLILIITECILAVFYYETPSQEYQFQTQFLLYILLGLSLVGIVVNLIKRECFNIWKSSQLKDYQIIGWQQTIFITIILFIQPYPFTQNIIVDNWDYQLKISLPLKLNYIFIFGSYLKIGILIRCIINISKFRRPRASRVCTIYGCQNSYLYAIKCYFIQSPVKMIIFILFSMVPIFAYALRIFEKHTLADDNILKYYQNNLWLVLITITSVGYGDIAPRTEWGQIIGFVCTFCGVLIVSVMILVVINTFELSSRQNNSLSLLNRVQRKRKLRQKAAIIIRIQLWRLWKNYKCRKQQKYFQIEQKTKIYRIYSVQFWEALRESKLDNDRQKNIGEDMDRQFQKTNDSLEKLDQNFDRMINHLSHKYFLNIQQLMNDKAQQI